MTIFKRSLLAMTLLSSLAYGETITEVSSDQSNQTNLSITIYNEELALINDQRTIPLDKGINHLLLKNVSAQIRSETSQLVPLGTGEFQIIEQNFDYDLLTPQSMLQKAVGYDLKIITVNPNTGEEKEEIATVLANNNGVILKYANRIETGLAPNSRFAFTTIPANLFVSPTLSILLNSPTKGEQAVELNYLSQGFGWQADYVATITPDEKMLDLAGWITLKNHSGTSFNNAKVQLIAGDINRVRTDASINQRSYDMPMMEMVKSSAGAMPKQEEFADMHLYTLPFKTSLNNNQEKQVALLSAQNIPVVKEYRFYSQPHYFYTRYQEIYKNIKAKIYLTLDNSEEQNLGIPLPKGIFRVYQQNSGGQPLFIGEDRINHIAKNEHFDIFTGEAFDVSVTRKQTDFKILSKYQSQSSHEVVINNAKKTTVTASLYENIAGYMNWEIIKESHPHTKYNANTALWSIDVPADSKVTFTYTVEHRSN